MILVGGHLIDGHWQRSTPVFTAADPATGQPLSPDFCEAQAEQVDHALVAAVNAMASTRDLDPRWPAGLLDGIADEVMKLGDALLERAGQETALPKGRLVSERGRTVGQLKIFAQIVRDGAWLDATIDTAEPGRQPLPKPDVRRMSIARGPVVVFGASNFPFAFSAVGGDTASALAAGNPVIVKGHPSHPGTSELFASAVLAALQSLNLPTGLFSLLQGRSNDVGAALVRHPATAAVGFTGSRKGGRTLFDLAAARPNPIPVFAEMGSLNPLIVMPGAISERGATIAKDLADSILLGGGQFCTKPGVILTIGDTGDFVAALQQHIAATASVTMLNQGLRDAFLSRVKEWAHLHGVAASTASAAIGFAATAPLLFQTTAAVFLSEPALREEAFGPAALLVKCDDIQQIGRVLSNLGGNLTGTIHAGAADNAVSAVQMLQSVVGRIVINGYPTGVEVCNAMVHGGPYPATSDANSTSVGSAAIRRFSRMVAYQNTPDAFLPPALKNSNPLKIERTVNGRRTTDAL